MGERQMRFEDFFECFATLPEPVPQKKKRKKRKTQQLKIPGWNVPDPPVQLDLMEWLERMGKNNHKK